MQWKVDERRWKVNERQWIHSTNTKGQQLHSTEPPQYANSTARRVKYLLAEDRRVRLHTRLVPAGGDEEGRTRGERSRKPVNSQRKVVKGQGKGSGRAVTGQGKGSERAAQGRGKCRKRSRKRQQKGSGRAVNGQRWRADRSDRGCIISSVGQRRWKGSGRALEGVARRREVAVGDRVERWDPPGLWRTSVRGRGGKGQWEGSGRAVEGR